MAISRAEPIAFTKMAQCPMEPRVLTVAAAG
jgi:hypothetical protein